MEQEITADKLRDTAGFVEKRILAVLDDLSDVSFPLVVGGAKQFPRPAPEGRAAERGVEVLRKDAEDAIAALHALAVALELELPGADALLAAFQPSIQPFIAAFQEAEGRQGEVQATPAAKREAEALGMDLSRVEGTGAGGRITVRDVQNAAQEE